MRRVIWAALLALSFPCAAAFERSAPSAALIGFGGAGAAHGEAVSSRLNPAAYEENHWIALCYNQPFGVDGLRESFVQAGAALGLNAAARVSWHQFGNALHVEDTISLAGRIGGENLAAGARGSYRSRRTQGFSDAQTYSADIGAVWRASPQIKLGAALQNAGLNAQMRAGARVEMGGQTAFLADAFTDGNDAGIAVGGEWRAHPNLTLRAGTHNLPWQWAVGFSVRFAGLSFDYALETHPALNATHYVGIALYAP